MNLSELDTMPAEQAREAFERCCGARHWVNAMVGERPFRSPEALYMASEREL